jgi:glycosyltransferase involved in cell wall biosynthesis
MAMDTRASASRTYLREVPVTRVTDARVLMVGPDRSLRGGIVSVVDGYFGAGLQKCCARLDYHGTGVGSNLLAKSLAFARSLASYSRVVDDYDVVHLHISAKGSYQRKKIMARIAERRGKRVILHEHSGEFARDFETGDDAYRADVRRTFGYADRVIVLSEEWRDYFAENVCDPERVVVIHNGVGVPPEPCNVSVSQNVLFLGRLDENKSPDVLIRASRRALAEFSHARLIFAGDGDINRYGRLANELGIADRCEFLGWVSGDDKEQLFQRAGIYCLPSKHEAMPLSVMEAMARGIPVISTSVGGVPQLIEDGADGLLMKVDDEAGLSELLLGLERSPERRVKLGLAGRRRIEETFSIDASVDRLVSLYDELMREGAR